MALQEELELKGNYLFKYRSYLPLIILVIGLLVFVLGKYQELATNKQIIDFNILIGLSFFVSFLGFLIRVLTAGYAAKNTSGRNANNQLADSLNTTGMYSIIRHPLYVGNFLMWLGLTVLTANIYFIIIFSLAFWLFYERIMFAEEQFLRKKYGDTFLKWSKNTGAFIPTFRSWKKAQLPFSWKRVLKKEKNGFSAVFLLIFIFDSVGRFIKEEPIITYDNWLMYATAFTFLLYWVLKFITRKTSLFDEN